MGGGTFVSLHERQSELHAEVPAHGSTVVIWLVAFGRVVNILGSWVTLHTEEEQGYC